jgi:glycosyltransferase involved in cell wall biosynthesis
MKFSIITPSFRNSKWLKLCIASVADQEGVEFEHIIQDSCSDDGTLDWLPKDPRVKAFIEKDSGMYDAVNRGLRRASGDILAYLNCDEQLLPGALKEMEKFFEQHPKVEVALAGSVVVDPEGKYICHRPSIVPTPHEIWFRFTALTSSIFFRRGVIAQRKLLFDTQWRAVGDMAWFFDLMQNKVPMSVADIYTSAFVERGENMGLSPGAVLEQKKIGEKVPEWVIKLRLFWITKYRLKRILAGHLNMKPTGYSIYTINSPDRRVMFDVPKPTTIWWNRH